MGNALEKGEISKAEFNNYYYGSKKEKDSRDYGERFAREYTNQTC
jgi:hypothetical protein